MKDLTKRSSVCSKTLLCALLALMNITKIGNMETRISYLESKQTGTQTCKNFLKCGQNYSNANKILSCFPNSVLQNYTEFGNHDNISLVLEAISTPPKRECLMNITREVPKVSRKQLRVKQDEELISLWNLIARNTTGIQRKEYSIIDLILYTVVLCATLVTSTNSTFYFQKSKHSSRSKSEIKSRYSYDFIFQLGNQSVFEFKIYHFSLKKYLNEIEKSSDKNVKRMNHEWARYESFKTFPEDCAASALRLAQAGFYYTGKGVEAICFWCGLKNEKWTNNESVFELHKRLSPNCKFMKGEKTENVPIHGTEEAKQNTTGGACGGPEDLSESNRVTDREQIEHRNALTRTRTEVLQETEQNIEHVNTPSGNNYQNSLENEGHSLLQSGYTGRYMEYRPTEEIQHFPGITNEQPKHPDYAIKSVRLSSFLQWPSSHLMKPDDLAEAGFFFTGMQDLVRCFFCGGGMKNWEYGDSPWIEHARWFPTCAYLKQCKGEDFVNLCQISNMTFPTQNNFQLRDLDSQQENIVEDQNITDLNSIAAKRLLDMGYMQTQVEDAIRHTRQRIGPSEELKAQYLLEYLLDNSYTRANASATTTTVTQRHHSPTVNNSGHASSPNASQSDKSKASIDTAERNSPEVRSGSPSAGKSPKATKNERQSLKEENRHLKEQMMCKICLDKDANIVFLPCGHLVSCVECAHALRKCAVCRTTIQGTVRAYPA